MIHECMSCHYFGANDYWLDDLVYDSSGNRRMAVVVTAHLAKLSDDAAINGGGLRHNLGNDILEAVGLNDDLAAERS